MREDNDRKQFISHLDELVSHLSEHPDREAMHLIKDLSRLRERLATFGLTKEPIRHDS